VKTLKLLKGLELFGRFGITALRIEDMKQREEHWIIADLIGKGRHIRSVPVPDWVKKGFDE
jgi:hypothetical protein